MSPFFLEAALVLVIQTMSHNMMSYGHVTVLNITVCYSITSALQLKSQCMNRCKLALEDVSHDSEVECFKTAELKVLCQYCHRQVMFTSGYSSFM